MKTVKTGENGTRHVLYCEIGVTDYTSVATGRQETTSKSVNEYLVEAHDTVCHSGDPFSFNCNSRPQPTPIRNADDTNRNVDVVVVVTNPEFIAVSLHQAMKQLIIYRASRINTHRFILYYSYILRFCPE